jgi:hypothetical protein
VKQHYSEADLLETHYAPPGDSMPVMMHLADCSMCASRYEKLEAKLRGLAACEHEKPETFWARQRVSIMRKVQSQRRFSFTRAAAAALLVAGLGGLITWRVAEPDKAPLTNKTPAVAIALEESSSRPLEESETPWESDELSEFQSMVAWESWVESAGDQSL